MKPPLRFIIVLSCLLLSDIALAQTATTIIERIALPGNGGFRTIEKYRCKTGAFVLANRSHFMFLDGGKKWISEKNLRIKAEEMDKKFPAVREVKTN